MSVFTGEFTSECANKNIVVRVIFPDSPYDLEQVDKEPKTMYLLHGGGGSSGDWLRFTNIEFFARKYNFTIVMADADGSSFYSDMVYGGNYLKFFGEELPKFVNDRFNLPKNTYICGQSMGGYGCIKVGLTYPENYKAIGCLSGGVDIKSLINLFSKNESSMKQFKAIFGDPIVISDDDDLYCLTKKVVNLKDKPKIYGCCGKEDFLYQDNVKFYKYLDSIGYENEVFYNEGIHMWDYWDRNMPLIMEKLCKHNIGD